MKYLAVFAIRIRHAFYGDGRCADFSLEPDPASQRLLANHRMIARARPDGVEVFAPLDPDQTPAARPFIPFRPDLALSFYLRLQNPDFTLFTDLDGLSGLQDPVFENPESGASGELAVRGHDTPLPLLEKTSVFARIRIRSIAAAWLDGGPVQYTITFQPRQTRWAFYFISDKLNGNGRGNQTLPRIVDDDPARADAPLHFDTAMLDPAPDAPTGSNPGDIVDDDIARNLASRYPDHQRFRIVSSDRLACQQEARKRLALYLGDEKLSNTVANPSLRNFSTLGIQTDGDDLERQESLFHVVMH